MTPSGFNMGTILKTNFSLRTKASGEFPTRKSIIPFIIQLELVSPGCTRALKKTPLLSDFYYKK